MQINAVAEAFLTATQHTCWANMRRLPLRPGPFARSFAGLDATDPTADPLRAFSQRPRIAH